MVTLRVDGHDVEVPDGTPTLLDALRSHAGALSVKDGCSPQGQCGCCTVLVDGAPRVACVTPVRRLAGREITTFEGLDPERRSAWAEAFVATGASQCGFCSPGIVCRLEGSAQKAAKRSVVGASADGGPPEGEAPAGLSRPEVERALAAHLCRCTGWQPITEAALGLGVRSGHERDGVATQRAGLRAVLEGGAAQHVGPDVVAGRAGFAADTAPDGAAVVVSDGAGGWVAGDSLFEARAAAGKVQGRRSTAAAEPPVAVPDGEWAVRLATSWVEPAYLETDASWCEPGGEPATPLANGGAFGAKRESPVTGVAREWADRLGRPVLAMLSREDSVRLGVKRPPIAAGLRTDGTGRVLVGWSGDGDPTPVLDRMSSVLPLAAVEVVPIVGPPTSSELRAAGWAEAQALAAALAGTKPTDVVVSAPEGGVARVEAFGPDGITVAVSAGDPLDDVVLRSFVIGAVHAALGWVATEGLAVVDGEVADLTIRSFGILRAADLPPVTVAIDRDVDGDPAVPVAPAVFAAVAAAAWSSARFRPTWPLGGLPWTLG
ncbi:MAG: 2Fe-2S iron-sulfur cluster-binding protein [Microthrixaceae bacterium]